MSKENIISTEPRQTHRVNADYKVSNTNPFSVTTGEVFQVSEKSDFWNNNPHWIWIWCTDQHGRSGWVPKNLIDFHADGMKGIARYSYAATELAVVVGDELIAEKEESGWIWCKNKQGESGWVPLENVAQT